jgi:hypothetical protein
MFSAQTQSMQQQLPSHQLQPKQPHEAIPVAINNNRASINPQLNRCAVLCCTAGEQLLGRLSL